MDSVLAEFITPSGDFSGTFTITAEYQDAHGDVLVDLMRNSRRVCCGIEKSRTRPVPAGYVDGKKEQVLTESISNREERMGLGKAVTEEELAAIKKRQAQAKKPKAASDNGCVLVIDVSGLIHRVWHCGNNAGHPTATANWSLHCVADLIRDYGPSKVVLAREGGNEFRLAIYPKYKEQRDPKPEGLQDQIELFVKACLAIGWPALSASGYEADDVMATLARVYSSRKVECVLATGDKDLRQLLTLPHVKIIDTRLNGGEIDAEHVMKRFAVKPEQLGDLLAMAGDECDGIPGVERVGEVTAAKWLAEHGTLENIIEWSAKCVADKSCPKSVRMLHEQRDIAIMSRKLVELQNCKPVCAVHGKSTDWPKWPIKGWENKLEKLGLVESIFSLVNILKKN